MRTVTLTVSVETRYDATFETDLTDEEIGKLVKEHEYDRLYDFEDEIGREMEEVDSTTLTLTGGYNIMEHE
jgi:hypothetical protein